MSAAFVDAYRSLADNYETSYLANLPLSRPKMLIISHNQLDSFIGEFINWKRAQGFEVYVINKQSIAANPSVQQIKDAVYNHYMQYQCDYLLILGDVTGTFTIPTNIYPSPDGAEQDADDGHYGNLTGDDYFPEMLVGRFSFGDISECLTMINKSIRYEKNPHLSDTAWYSRALVVAGNYAEGGLRPTTPVLTSRWLREKMLGFGYSQVDTVFYPPSYPATSTIQAAINAGVSIVTYRGWGDANGWHYPLFHIPNLNSTFNGARMPIVFSIVCNTGDFANLNVNPCFGEKWMRMGSISSPNGAVAFVGPSDLHTRTRLNNSISSGMWSSIYDYGVRIFGSSVLAGKIEIYKNFPNDTGTNGIVPFYFHIYNMLSDPSLNMWILTPAAISPDVIVGGTTFTQSDAHIRISAPHLNNAIVTGTKNNEDFGFTRISGGFAILPVDPDQDGDLTITISKENYLPLVTTLAPAGTPTIGVSNNSLTAAGTVINPHQTYTLNLTLKNYGSIALSNVTATLTSDRPQMLEIPNNTHNISSLGAGQTTTASFTLNATHLVQPRQIITFNLVFSPVNVTHSFQLITGGAEISFVSYDGILHLGQNNTVTFTIINNGTAPLINAGVSAFTQTTAAVVTTPVVNLGNVAVGETKTFQAGIQIASDTFNGRNIPLRFLFTDAQNYSFNRYYAVTAGVPTTTAPTGPCEYGYWAYDSFDTTFPLAPVYNWTEIDPRDGGQGTVFLNQDDGTVVVDLPFTFRFYGNNYNQLSICSNGWVSFFPTWMVDFNNQYIPAALGPYTMLAPYWDDLKGMKIGEDPDGNGIFADMRMIYWHDAANNRFIVEWNDAYNQYTIDLGPDAHLEKFQVILYPQAGRDGDIVYQYHTIDNPGTGSNYCTVGIENHSQKVGLTYSHANFYPPTATPLQAGLAIKFTTIPPDSHVGNDDAVNASPIQLGQNYPNPFNPTTTIAFSTRQTGWVKVSIYNLKGQLIKTLSDTEMPAGEHSLTWDGTDHEGASVSSGVYFYRLQAAGHTQTRKMLLMK
ncbi:MAG: T9SS type A sorting domain-containing protein [Candidatus Cloacimonetes bacterium]|nr:T9SS type A sorting domain-containing protein [Candidatus Cloacimonadota bacterium]